MSITVSDIHLDHLQGPADEYIMNAANLQRYSPSQQCDINLVRMWLQVTTLADMSDSDRTNRISLSYLDVKRSACFVSSETTDKSADPPVEAVHYIIVSSLYSLLENSSSNTTTRRASGDH